MACPTCGFDPLPRDAKFCPNCGRNLAPRTEIKIDQQVEHNLGRVIGVQTGAIHGDVFGGDIYQVQLYALSGPTRAGDWQRFLEEDTPPYRYLSPYRVQDQAIFMGRATESAQLLSQIGQQQLVVLFGSPGVGKTSLVAAGVTPDLLENGALVVHIHDPLHPVKSLRAALAESTTQLPPLPPDAQTLPEVVGEVVKNLEGSLVLVLDQFERLFEPSVKAQDRAALIESLSRSLHVVPAEFYRVLIVIQEKDLGQLAPLQEWLPELLRFPFHLQPLSGRQAKAAIEKPLVPLNFPVSYVGDFVGEQLIPDLDELSPLPGIHPPHLQVVCHWLYRAARTLQPPHIDEKLYHAAKEADGIVARHFENILENQLGSDRKLGEEVLIHFASGVEEQWVSREQLPHNGTPAEQFHEVLERLVTADLLLQRTSNGRSEYALSSPILGEFIPVIAGPQAEYSLQSDQELARVWGAWLARGVPATRGQLRFIHRVGGHSQPNAVESLLLLYSAVSRDMDASPWLEDLRTGQGTGLIRLLEGLPGAEEDIPGSRSGRNKAALLLGFQDPVHQERPPGGEELFGPVSWSAVKATDPAHRHTAALALSVLGTQLAIGRLDLALRAAWSGWGLRVRAAELRGVLADSDPEMEEVFSNLPFIERVAIWGWRARRQIFRDRHQIFWLTMGGAFGAALGMALLRLVSAVLAERMLVGGQIFIAAIGSWILGAALSFGIVLVESLLLKRRRDDGETPGIWRAPLHPDRLPAVIGIFSGTLFFWLGHTIVLAFSSQAPVANITSPLRTVMVLLAGLGLSVALYGQPWASLISGYKGWLRRPRTLLRIGFASLAILVGEVVHFTMTGRNSLVIAWGRDIYNSAFFDRVNQLPQIAQQVPGWATILAYLEAVLIGIVMTIGISAGLVLALTWLTRWRELLDLAGD